MVSHNVSDRANLLHIATVRASVTARCSACGASWRYQRHEALTCPMCAAHFTMAYMTAAPDVGYVDFDAEGGCTAR